MSYSSGWGKQKHTSYKMLMLKKLLSVTVAEFNGDKTNVKWR